MSAPLPPFALLLPAAGAGRRVGAACNKLLLPVAGEPLLAHTLRAVVRCQPQQIVLVCRDDEREAMAAIAQSVGATPTFATGGATRQESVANGLAALSPEIELVAVHDAARPFVTPEMVTAALESAREFGSGVVARPATDTLKVVRHGVIDGALDRNVIWSMQTPQVFTVALLRRAAEAASRDGFVGTDEASLVERLGEPVHVVEGSARNIKITTPDDFPVAESLLGRTTLVGRDEMTPRIGYGYDIHETDPTRPMWLGGVHIVDSPFGLKGHSDADVLLHAICDAMLGALALGDIGIHFPTNDPRYEGISSLKLLAECTRLITEKGWKVHNIDATLVAEKPKLAPHVAEMQKRIAAAIGVAPDQISLKATTNETLDDVGACRGLCAQAVALVVPL